MLRCEAPASLEVRKDLGQDLDVQVHQRDGIRLHRRRHCSVYSSRSRPYPNQAVSVSCLSGQSFGGGKSVYRPLETTFRSSSPTHELCMNCLANQAETCSRNRCIGEGGALWRHTLASASRPPSAPPTWCTPRVPHCKAVNIARFAFRPELAPRDSCVASFRSSGYRTYRPHRAPRRAPRWRSRR